MPDWTEINRLRIPSKEGILLRRTSSNRRDDDAEGHAMQPAGRMAVRCGRDVDQLVVGEKQ